MAARATAPTPGGAAPLGAQVLDHGVRFALYSEHATAVDLCLFDRPGDGDESRRIPMERGADAVWSVLVPAAGPGQLYGFRAHGPYEPARGHRFNPAKLLVDPYARALTGAPAAGRATRGYQRDLDGDRPCPIDSAAAMPKAIVVGAAGGPVTPRPRIRWRDTVIYECHVKGMTRRHPEVPAELRGTYSGLVQPPVIDHLRRLGVTAVELLPVQQSASEPRLLEGGRSNYFGYNPLALFAPHGAYATGQDGRQVAEFRHMVEALHRAGMEVLLDVVFNHTAEGDDRGPTLSWRGLDNRVYYRLDPRDPGRYRDFSGCGNSLDCAHPAVARLVLDCLRYWVETMGVDGFRVDLATSLGRDADGRFRPRGSLLERLLRDPVLAEVKWIAEPWDLGPGGYRLGKFPDGWREWNDRYRDSVRSFWRGDGGRSRQLANALNGSPDVFAVDRRRPTSIDYVTCHDGFTLEDLVSYSRKHNRDNGHGNRDGHDQNFSRNWGVEGPSEKPDVQALRRRVKRSLLATLALTRGVPMLSHGDELGRSQAGNNNAYCHDSELTWIDWDLDDERRALLRFTRRLLALRRRFDVGPDTRVEWLAADGHRMTAAGWADRDGVLGAVLATPADELLLLCNGSDRSRLFRLPVREPRGCWRRLLSSAGPGSARPRGGSVRLLPHCLMLLRHEAD